MLYSCSNRDTKARKSPVDNLFENEIRGAVKGWEMEIKEMGSSSKRMYIRNIADIFQKYYTQRGYNAKLWLYYAVLQIYRSHMKFRTLPVLSMDRQRYIKLLFLLSI
jgi:hypothetical protein